jgi:hypothetical protein
MQLLIKAIEQLRERDGTYPLSEADLVELLGAPLPSSGWGTDIVYTTRMSDGVVTEYTLWSLIPPNYNTILRYDSKKPVVGIVQTQPY